MSKCVSSVGEFSDHIMLKSQTGGCLVCSRCAFTVYADENDNHNEVEPTPSAEASIYVDGIEVDSPAFISQGDWNKLCLQVAEVHMFLQQLKNEMAPMVEKMKTGGIMSLLMGLKSK